jgi:hypothetical protein
MGLGDWGRQAMPAMQSSFTAAPQVARGPVLKVNSDFAQRYASTTNPDRPYKDIGKQTLNLTRPGAFAANLPSAGGFVEGFGAGAGRVVGGMFGQADLGANIGRGIGHIPQVGLDAVGGVLGNMPALPFLPGGGGVPGASLLRATDEERSAFFKEWQGNPFGLMKALGEHDKEDWAKQIEEGGISPILRSLGPSTNAGEQLMNTLGIFGLPSDLIQRGYAGGPGAAIDRVMNAPEEDLNPEVIALRERFKAGEIKEDRFLDELVVNGAGYSNNWVVNLLGSAVLDPANLAFGAGTAIGLASKGAGAARAVRFVDELGETGVRALTRQVAERSVAEGGAAISEAAVTPYQIMEEAIRTGAHSDVLARATKALPARQQAALHPGFARLEKIADFTQGILDPTNLIGRRGSKPITNAYLSREGTKGIAQGYGIENYSRLGDALDVVGKGDLFDEGMGYFGAQEGLLMAGDSLADDVIATRRLSDARPTKVAQARAGVGAQNYAMKMERWIGRRKADLAILTGGTKEEALARAHTHAKDRLTRLGLSGDQADAVLRRLGGNEDAYSLVDAMYFGNRIKTHNAAKRAARETLNSQIANNADGLPTKAQAARMDTVDRTTLIGPRELTDLRAKNLRDALNTGDIEAVRTAVRQYDILAVEFLADGTDEAVLLAGVKSWLDEFEGSLTKELDDEALRRLPGEIVADAQRGDGYVYGLRPEGEDEWRIVTHAEDDLENGIRAGDIKHARPWVDITGDRAETWNLRFRDPMDRNRIKSMANTLERKTRLMGQQITSDKIDRESRRRFVEGAMTRGAKPVDEGGQGLTVNEARDLYDAVKRQALETGAAPRGLMIGEFDRVIAANKAASRVGLSGHDLQMLTLQSFEGNVGTVGLTQKLSGKAKTELANIPLMPSNFLGIVAERMYPLVRFSINPVFQMQEWVEPWVFSAARGRQARLTGQWKNPITGETVTLDDVQMIQQHLMERYKASSPEAQFDMMERSLVYLSGAKAAKQAAAAVDRNMLRQAIHNVSVLNVHERKAAAQSEMFRYFLGPMLKDQFDQINPNIWLDLEKTFGTTDQGQIAVRWLVEKDKWANADPRVAYHLMDAAKEPAMGARAAVNLEENARVAFNTSREAINHRVTTGALSRDEFVDTMRELGAHQDYIERTWKATQFEVKTGGVDQWWDDAVPLVAGGKPEVTAVRKIVQALADTQGISETELLSRTMQSSPVSLMHDDLISATEADLAAWGTLLQQNKRLVNYYRVAEDGAVSVDQVAVEVADDEFLSAAMNPPASIPVEQHGNIADMQKVQFGEGGRTMWVPGGEAALRDLETPWTAWEAHVLRSQVLNPVDLKDPALKHALDEKMWRGHTIDMESTDPDAVARLFNNYNMALHSAQMTLTRNEMVATRFRVANRAELESLVADATALRNTIERAVGRKATVNEMGLAYSTQPGISHYIPLDDRLRHMGANMLPERVGPDGKTIASTQSLVEERATVASMYLRGTTKEQRARYTQMEEAGSEYVAQHGSTGPLHNWAIEQIADTIEKGGIDALDTMDPIFRVKRAALIKEADRPALLEAAAKLAEDPMDAAARAVIAPYATRWKGHDGDIIFKPWNVNGAGLPAGKNIDGAGMFHGDQDTFAYLKNDDVAWRSTATNANMGRSLLMAQDMLANPDFFVRRRGTQFAPAGATEDLTPFQPARFGTDARGNATIPEKFQSEEGFVYRVAPQQRAGSNWKVGEYVARHPATIYAENENSVVLRVRQDKMSWDEAVSGVDASQNLRAKGAVHAGDVEIMAADGTWHPVLDTVESALEPLDEFGERISHRTNGLSLKTGFFGADLGDPLNFPKGVHDLHMVGDLTEWMYYTKGAKGKNAEWRNWLATLSAEKQALIQKWIGTGAPRGAGVFKWAEAQGVDIKFVPGEGQRAALDAGTVAEKAAWVRRRLDEAVADESKPGITTMQRDRMERMYRTDEEWADLYDRDLKMFGGDYEVFENTMSRRKAEAEAIPGPEAEGLKRHGNGGYQWKLWDERRHIWDPETTAFASSHAMPRRDIRYYASSDDGHNLAGFYKNEGQPSVEEAGYSVLDPVNTIMAQQDGRVIRGATIMTDTGDKIIGLTQYRNRSTFLHEITHAVIEPLVTDPSMKRVVFEDLNRVIDERNATLITRTGELRTQLDEITNVVADRENVVIEAQTATKVAKSDLDVAATTLRQAEAKAADLTDRVTMQQGALKQLRKDAPAKRKAANARKYPSERQRGLDAVEGALTREQEKLDALIKSRDEATAAVEPARSAHVSASELHVALSEHLRVSQTELAARKAEGAAIRKEYDEVATRMPEARKFGWDRETSEHFADEFGKWLATGEAKNPKMRDAFAYFRKVLIRIFEWAKANPKAKVSPELEQLFNDLTMPIQREREALANAVPFDATDEMMHAAGIQSVVDAEDAAFTNVQFRRNRSWLERSVNHPYMGMYPASYMWGKVAPEMVRALSVNPFGLPVPFLTKPVKINGVEYGLHGSPFYGFVNANRVQNAIELQKDSDPEFNANVNDPKNDKVFRNFMMFLPASPWDAPANFPLWSRRVAEYGAETIDEPLTKQGKPKEFNIAKTGSEIVSYAFGPKAGFDWIDDMAKATRAPFLGGDEENALTPQALSLGPGGAVPVEERLTEAATQLQQQLPQPPQP